MPHQNVHSSRATAQNAATPSSPPNDPGREQNAAARPEPSSYAAEDWREASLAAPAAGEVADYMDEGEPLGDAEVHQGGARLARGERTEALMGQGPKTRAANRRIVKSGQAD